MRKSTLLDHDARLEVLKFLMLNIDSDLIQEFPDGCRLNISVGKLPEQSIRDLANKIKYKLEC